MANLNSNGMGMGMSSTHVSMLHTGNVSALVEREGLLSAIHIPKDSQLLVKMTLSPKLVSGTETDK
jgi:hypothetical protein